MNVAKLFGVAGKHVLVTGGGRGIGKMIATGFVQNGATVYIVSRKMKVCEATAEELSAAGPGRCVPFAEDLATEEGCKRVAERLREHTDALHVLVNNSGATWGEAFDSYPAAAWDKLFSLNVRSVFLLTRACLPLLDRGSTPDDPARVINIGSIAGIGTQPIPAYAYDASKAAVHHLTKKLASDLADRRAAGGHRVTVNAIAPGLVPSDMSKQLLTYASSESLGESTPLGRIGTPEDMAGAALYLASRAGAWVTGVILPVDGGVCARPLSML